MERIIPYDHKYCLGFSVDVTKCPVECGRQLVSEDVIPVIAQPNFTTAQFSFVECMKDVCDVLGIPPEYALKVQAGLLLNPVVLECLKDIYRKDNMTVVFRVNFLQQKILLPHDVKLSASFNEGESSLEDMEKKDDSNLAAELPVCDSEDKGCGTHVVSALEVGNELVVILKISTPDQENFHKFCSTLKETLKQSRGILEEGTFSALGKFALNMDKKLKKKHYQDVSCLIQYGCFSDQEKYPASLSGMVKTLEGFVEKTAGWADLFKDGVTTAIEPGKMMLNEGVDSEEKKGYFKTFTDFVMNKDDADTKLAESPLQVHSDVDGDHDSFVVLASEKDQMFYIRATLQSDQLEDEEIESFTSYAMSQYPETSSDRFEKLFKILLYMEEAICRLQALFNSKRFMCEDRIAEGNNILHSVQNIHMEVHDAIRKLDMVTMPSEEFVENLCSANPLHTVDNYVENVMSKLPPGCDLDLLIIGKTGHGKSSTGNTILGEKKFEASARSESVTRSSTAAWSNIDGRIIKVVDTPGVCDTADDKNSIDQAILAISEAISQCPGGFHALLLVIRFGQRMTMEEKKAIGMLKCILGENVIKSHCICVVTHGDNFETEMEGRKTFQQWCQEEGGFLKDVFEECQYRCVLFDNKSKDPKVAKSELIELVAKVDSLKSQGTRYTNSLFEFAQRERQRIITEEKLPPVSQDMMRDIELVLDHLKRVAKNTKQRDKYASELENLKGMVENLSNRVTEVEGEQVKLLVETVFSLAEVIHGEIDKIADKATPDPPNNDSGDCVDGCGSYGNESAVAISQTSLSGVNLDLQTQTQNLQTIRDTQLSVQAKKLDSKVAEQVAQNIKEKENCFPSSSKVLMKNGQVKEMEYLEVGDEVLVRNMKGELCYDTVYMFGHADPESMAEYFVLHVEGQCVSVSDNHLVFCIRNGQELCLATKNIQINDKLIVKSSNDKTDCLPVLRITRERKQGLFAPFTKCGTIVVDSVVMSCYVDVLPHTTAHALLSPMRQLYRFSPSTLAFVNGTSKNKGVPAWAKFALKWVG